MKDALDRDKLRESFLKAVQRLEAIYPADLLEKVRCAEEQLGAMVSPELLHRLDPDASLKGETFVGAEVSASFFQSMFGSLEAFEQLKEGQVIFQDALVKMREALRYEPVPNGNLFAMARLVDYLKAALSDPVVRQSAPVLDLADLLVECISDSSLRNPSWEKALAPIIEEGARAQSARYNQRRKKLQPREAFKEWVMASGTTVVRVDEFRSMSEQSMPGEVFVYVMKTEDRYLRKAYNEVRPGTLRRGRGRKKK